jgi:hypothetical protein
MASGYTEDHQVEQPAIDLFDELGWETLNAYQEGSRHIRATYFVD